MSNSARPSPIRRFRRACVGWLRTSLLFRVFKSLLGERRWQRLKGFLLARRRQAPAATAAVSSDARGPLQGAWGLNVVGYLRSESGVGEAVRSSLRASLAAGLPVAATDVDLNDFSRKRDRSCEGVPSGNPHAVNLFHVNADQSPWVLGELGPEFRRGKHNVGYWFWEVSKFPADWQDSFRLFDEIWVATSYVQEVLSQVAPAPVVKVPLTVAPSIPETSDCTDLGIPADAFVYLYIFDLASVLERKNPRAAIEAFRCMTWRRDALLVLKVNNARRYAERLRQVRRAVRGLNALVIDDVLRREDVNRLLFRCDAYISPHRSEGFGLTMAEAMYYGKPVIGTAYSANMDFMTAFNSYLLDYTLTPVGPGAAPYPPEAVWAEPNIEHLAELMARVYSQRDEAERVGQRAAADIRRLYSRSAIGDCIRRRCEWIWAQRAASVSQLDAA